MEADADDRKASWKHPTSAEREKVTKRGTAG
jgi:hypothetical protein